MFVGYSAKLPITLILILTTLIKTARISEFSPHGIKADTVLLLLMMGFRTGKCKTAPHWYILFNIF